MGEKTTTSFLSRLLKIVVKLGARLYAMRAEAQKLGSVAVGLTIVEEKRFLRTNAELIDAHLEYSLVGFASMCLVG